MADEETTNNWTGMADEIMNIMPSVSRIQVCFILRTDMLLGSW
jgi:hypothetical protein